MRGAPAAPSARESKSACEVRSRPKRHARIAPPLTCASSHERKCAEQERKAGVPYEHGGRTAAAQQEIFSRYAERAANGGSRIDLGRRLRTLRQRQADECGGRRNYRLQMKTHGTNSLY